MEQVLITVITSSIFSGIILAIVNWKTNSFEKKEDVAIEKSKELLENVFSKFHFNMYTKNRKRKLRDFIRYCDKNKYSGYIYELREDAEELLNLSGSVFNQKYVSFNRRYSQSIVMFRNKVGSKISPSQTQSSRIDRDLILGGVLIIQAFVIFALTFGKYNLFIWVALSFSGVMGIVGIIIFLSTAYRDSKLYRTQKK